MEPKNLYPIYDIEQPSTKKKIKFRPYLVKEEKILLMAKESKQVNDVFSSIIQIIKACCEEPNFNIDDLPIFDLEKIFLSLRAFSVKNVEIGTVHDNEDEKDHNIIIDFDKIEIKFPDPPVSKTIKGPGNISILMKYPNASIYNDNNEILLEKIKKGDIFDLVIECIDSVYNKDILLKKTKKQLIDFLDNLDIPTYQKMKNFLLNMPKIDHVITYKNSLKHDRYVRFNSIMDFFFWL